MQSATAARTSTDEVAVARPRRASSRSRPSNPSSRGGRLAVERVAGAGQRARPRAARRSPAAGSRPAGRGRARASRRRPAGGGRGGPAGPAGCGSSRAGSRSPSRSASPTSARSRPRTAASSASIVRRSQSRRSVATWSLRERPVWSLPGQRPDPRRRGRPRGSCGRPRGPGPRRACRPRPRPAGASSPATSVVDLVGGQQAGSPEPVDMGDRAGRGRRGRARRRPRSSG